MLEDNCNKKQDFKLHPIQLKIYKEFSLNNKNGLLLAHSVGAGKTLTGALLANKFQRLYNYDVMWITRTTLKKEIEKTKDFLELKNDINILTYKQFSNACSKRGYNYEMLVKVKGEKDILHNTLIIVDEAHKLYAENQLKHQEQHNIKAIEDAIFNSYEISGHDRARVVLLTATPITNHCMDFYNIMNLLMTNKKDRIHLEDLKDIFNQDGLMTKKGMINLKNKYSKVISFTDTSKDRSKFAKVHNIEVPILYDLSKSSKRNCDKERNICEKLNYDKNKCKDLFGICKKHNSKETIKDIIYQRCDLSLE